MSQDLGSAYQTAALPFPAAGLPASTSANRRSFSTPSITSEPASLKRSLYAFAFMIAYMGVFFGAGYAVLKAIGWAWGIVVR